jgi:hypothetical protein
LPLLSPANVRHEFCEDCAACRHARQAYCVAIPVDAVVTEPFASPAQLLTPPRPALALARAFDSRGPPAVAL